MVLAVSLSRCWSVYSRRPSEDLPLVFLLFKATRRSADWTDGRTDPNGEHPASGPSPSLDHEASVRGFGDGTPLARWACIYEVRKVFGFGSHKATDFTIKLTQPPLLLLLISADISSQGGRIRSRVSLKQPCTGGRNKMSNLSLKTTIRCFVGQDELAS